MNFPEPIYEWEKGIEYIPSYIINSDPFGEVSRVTEDVHADEKIMDALRRIFPLTPGQSSVILNPQDVSAQAMLTLFVEDALLKARMWWESKREDWWACEYLSEYMSARGSLFQRNILLFINNILTTNRNYNQCRMERFWQRCEDVVRFFDGVLYDLESCTEYLENSDNKKVYFTLHTEYPIDVCWDLESETTQLKFDDYVTLID